MDDELQRGLRARLAQVDERIEEYRRIVEAQQCLDALLTLRGDIAEEINEVIDDERVQVPPAEYQRIVNAQQHLDELLAERAQVAAEINHLINAQRVPLAPE